MDRNRILGMVCGYYLSRFDELAYRHLGFATQQATHEALGDALNVPPESIKNWRDEFDPVHDNPRQGWHRREMYPSRRRTIEALGHLAEGELLALVRSITTAPAGPSAQSVVQAVGDADDDDANDAFGLRGPTGAKAEEAFASFHAAQGKPVQGTLVDRRYDQCGYDYEIASSSGIICVEVKGLAGMKGGITFTDKEWRTAQEMGEAYFLALVRNVASSPTVSLVPNPAQRLSARMRTYTTVQTGWSVLQAELGAAETALRDM